MKALWGVRFFLQLNVVALPKWLYAGIKTVILNTHKRNIYWKITHSCKKNGVCYATAKILQCGRKNKVTVECAVGKIAARKNRETADTFRMQKDAKWHESS